MITLGFFGERICSESVFSFENQWKFDILCCPAFYCTHLTVELGAFSVTFYYDWASAKIVSISAHRVRRGKLTAGHRPVGLPDFWHVIVTSVFIRLNWRLCYLVEQLLNYRWSSFRNCHLSASYILRSFSKNGLTLFCYETLHK